MYTKGDENSDFLIVIRIVICFIECKEKSLDISLKRVILSKLNIKLKIMIQQGAIPSVFDPILGQTFIFGARGKVFSDEHRQNKRIPDGVAVLRKQLRVESLKAIELQKRMKFVPKGIRKSQTMRNSRRG